LITRIGNRKHRETEKRREEKRSRNTKREGKRKKIGREREREGKEEEELKNYGFGDGSDGCDDDRVSACGDFENFLAGVGSSDCGIG
jgi:hypothetical protein